MQTADEDEKLFLESTGKFEDGDFQGAFELFSQLAEQGESYAQDYLGIMYGAGLGVEKDDFKSLLYHKRASRNANSPLDFWNVARQYQLMGNRRRALYWLNKANARGDKSAALRLAKMLLENRRNDSRKRAVELLQLTADGIAPLEISEDEKEEAQELLRQIAES